MNMICANLPRPRQMQWCTQPWPAEKLDLIDLSDPAYVDDLLETTIFKDINDVLHTARVWGHIVQFGGFGVNWEKDGVVRTLTTGAARKKLGKMECLDLPTSVPSLLLFLPPARCVDELPKLAFQELME